MACFKSSDKNIIKTFFFAYEMLLFNLISILRIIHVITVLLKITFE